MNKDLRPYNNKGKAHGYWELYIGEYSWLKGKYVNGERTGYWKISDNLRRYFIL